MEFEGLLSAECTQADGRIWIVSRNGKIWSFPDEDDVASGDVFVDLKASRSQLTPHEGAKAIGAAYGIAFHPEYPKVPYCWISYTLLSKQKNHHLEDGTRLSRFRINFDEKGVPSCDVGSEKVLLTWLQGGHNGACLRFGPDGYLYVSAGDGEVPSPPDPRRSGQDVTNLLSTIMRIDVHTDQDRPLYSIPDDNPFTRKSSEEIGLSKATDPAFTKTDVLPEIWAYGFRNPWKMNFGPDGQLWVGDVGWELFEMVYNVKAGGNYGWSVMEGPQSVLPNQKRGPTPILPPALSYSHSEGASITGGYVYRGEQLPEYRGQYIFGDFATRRIWATEIVKSANGEADSLGPLVDLVSPSIEIVAFGEDTSGELLLLNFSEGTIYGLERNDATDESEKFPQQLSQTGLFSDTEQQIPNAGVIGYEINEPVWTDQATAERWVAVPSEDSIVAHKSVIRHRNSNLRERMTFPDESVFARTVSLTDDNDRNVRLETQVLHFNGQHWAPYSYVWNSEQTDAELAPLGGTELKLAEYGSFADRSTWTVHSRAECSRCHNSFVGEVLGFTLPQLNRDVGKENQISRLVANGLLTGAIPESPGETSEAHCAAMPSSRDLSHPLEMRARSYLAANCSHCHQKGGGGTATIDLQFATKLPGTKLISAQPSQGAFGLSDASIVSSGRPNHSVLLYRMASCGRGRMPHIGSQQVDAAGLSLIRDWIKSLPGASTESAVQPNLTSTAGALEYVHLLDAAQVENEAREELLAKARDAGPEIRNLFTRFQPPEYRRNFRSRIDSAGVLALQGDPKSGAKLFFEKSMQCANCHKVAGKGGQVGPALDGVGKRLKRAEILESILEPSKKIDPKFAAWTAITTSGKIVSGLIVDRSDGSVTLRTPKNENLSIAQDDIEELIRQPNSLMPDRLVNELTDQQIADLVAWLAAQTTE